MFLNQAHTYIIWFWSTLISYRFIHEKSTLIIFCLLLSGLLILYIIFKILTRPEYLAYQEDIIYDLKWRWNWKQNTISNIWCYCPKCDCALLYDDGFYYNPISNITKTDLICEQCDSQIIASIKGGNKDFIVRLAKREVKKRIITKAYKKS
ncbi:MAG: hypothetical protein R3331_02600 [Sulfurospirillaceae bacterium]|nr:hypothetical protein [Sulfurospirillaceae bacterium]